MLQHLVCQVSQITTWNYQCQQRSDCSVRYCRKRWWMMSIDFILVNDVKCQIRPNIRLDVCVNATNLRQTRHQSTVHIPWHCNASINNTRSAVWQFNFHQVSYREFLRDYRPDFPTRFSPWKPCARKLHIAKAVDWMIYIDLFVRDRIWS